MRSATLLGTNIRTTALGFGTASLAGRLSRSESIRLLDVAYEQGIRHFDTAPLYGYGESEEILGMFLRTHTDTTVTTKVGLAKTETGSHLFMRAKSIARPILRAFPALRKTARGALHAQSRTISDFGAESARKSLAASLKRLGRDHVDVLLLHECRATDLHDDRLLHFLTEARDRGHIRAFGVGTNIATVKYCLTSAQQYASVLQFPNNLREPNLADTPALSERACITHSPFGGIGNTTNESLEAAMGYAKEQNPDGIILFSSQDAQHIVDNVRAFE
jgi:D-threo-aldose 1-dehydrogenase